MHPSRPEERIIQENQALSAHGDIEILTLAPGASRGGAHRRID
jgi:hypothetical protein